MGKKKELIASRAGVREETPGAGDAAAGNRDMVFFYSRLTRTLESVCGGERLAARLAAARQEPLRAAERDKQFDSSVARVLRRLGIWRADEKAPSVPAFVQQVSDAVSRPPGHVHQLLQLFTRGDSTLSIKAVCGPTPDCYRCHLTKDCEYYNNPRKPAASLMTAAQRLMSGHEQAISDAELLGLVLFGEKGTGQESVVTTLLARYGQLRAIVRADAHEYAGIRDMGKGQSLRMAAISALYRRLLVERRGEILHIATAKDIYDRYAVELRDYRVEAAVLLMLDPQNNVIRDAWFCEGSPNLTHIGIADLLRPAVREFATRIALIHNHPSNDPNPSRADKEFTRKLKEACATFGLGFVDHVIVTENGYFSFAEQGILGD